MSHEALITSLYQIGVIQFGEFKLKSGQTSSLYLNLRKIISYPALLRQISNLFWETVHHCRFDLICGVPYTALPIATCLSLQHNIPMVIRRKEKKDYGTKQQIEGVFEKGQRCLIIEDVITSGASIMETVEDLKTAGLVIHDSAVLIDREQGGKQSLATQFSVHAILSMSEILQYLLKSSLTSPSECKAIEQYLTESSLK